jgi:hypothetical protein
MKIDYEVDDIVEYSSWDGQLHKAKVVERLHSSKPGESGFDGILLNHNEKHIFAYDSQILRIIPSDNEPIKQTSNEPVDLHTGSCQNCQLYQNEKCKDGHFVWIKHCYFFDEIILSTKGGERGREDAAVNLKRSGMTPEG